MDNNAEIERARNNLRISGYDHPENPSSSRSGEYLSYNENTVIESNTEVPLEHVYKKSDYVSYAKFTGLDPDKEVQRNSFCPECGQKAMYECRCEIGEMMCKMGHYWYYTKDGKIIADNPHKD